MSNPTERLPWSDDFDPRPQSELYLHWREISLQHPVTIAVGPGDPGGHTEQEQLDDHNLQHFNGTPSLSTATSLISSQRAPQSPRLCLSLSQHSLARPLEEASYSPVSSQPNSCQSLESTNSNNFNAIGSDEARSQHSLARPLEEATYAQETSQPLSEPASSQTASTRSSGPYMPLAFLFRHRNEQEPEQSNNAPFSNLHASPRAESAEAIFNDSQAYRSEGAISIHSLARPLEELHFWDTSPPPSPSVGAAEDTVNFHSQHSLARPLEELVFTDKIESDSPQYRRLLGQTQSPGSKLTGR